MRWHKLGRVFDPTAHRLPHGCTQYAQSPQALVMDDRVRIYFSTRSIDAIGGKFRSQIAYVDMTREMDRTLAISTHAVIPLGALGAFDEHGIFPINVLRHEGVVRAYTCGWSRRVSVSVETGIGLAYSDDDGRTFTKFGDGPVLTASLREPCLVGDPFVRVIGTTFHMWYIFGTHWSQRSEGEVPDRVYKIGHCTSRDGISWERDSRQIATSRLGNDECQALPTVIAIGSRHHMFFCYREAFDFRHNRDRSYRIGHAWSDDLVHWTRDDDDPSIDVTPGAWDGDMMCYPHAFGCDGRIYLLYNGNEFGRFGFGLAVLE